MRRFISTLASAACLFSAVSGAAPKKPNIVFILTDDQDAQMQSLDYMPNVQKLILEQGTHYRKHYCTVAWCCPSRVSLWTGKAAHNTNVTNVAYPYGGYVKFVEEGHNNNWLPLWLNQSGINTYYVGKLMNDHNITNYNQPEASGFTGSEFLLEPYTYEYWTPGFTRNFNTPQVFNGSYSTDLVAQRALGFLDDAMQDDKPFFVTLAPIAPHGNFARATTPGCTSCINATAPYPATRHANYYTNASVPRTENFNPEEPSGVDWIAEQPQLSAYNISRNDDWYRRRLQALLAVDDMVGEVVDKLEKAGELDNTYIFYSADNGYHISQHRLPPGKGCGFETDINVPLAVRGPGVPKNKVVDLTTSHTDLAPTFMQLLGLPLKDFFDGVPIPLTEEQITDTQNSGKAKEHVQIEFWSLANVGEYNEIAGTMVNNTYKGLRIVGETYGFYYSVWCSGSLQLYDMMTDSQQMHNLLPSNTSAISSNRKFSFPAQNSSYNTSIDVPMSKLVDRLDGLLFVLKTCKAEVCSDPWNTLLPDQGVYSLAEALDEKYDAYFQGLPKVQYESCQNGYLLDQEQPVWAGGEAFGNAKRSEVFEIGFMGHRV